MSAIVIVVWVVYYMIVTQSIPGSPIVLAKQHDMSLHDLRIVLCCVWAHLRPPALNKDMWSTYGLLKFCEDTNKNMAQTHLVYRLRLGVVSNWNKYACCILLVVNFSTIYDTNLSDIHNDFTDHIWMKSSYFSHSENRALLIFQQI